MNFKNVLTVNRVLLGLLMLVAGLMKLFVFTPSGVVENVTGKIVLFSWAPLFWAWVLILSEIVFGIAILASWKLKYTVWPPIVIMIVAAFAVYWSNWSSFIMHIVVASNYLMLTHKSK